MTKKLALKTETLRTLSEPASKKSVEARSRGEFGAEWAAALWGFDFRADYDGGREAGARRPG